jgi:hypothetical protein
MAGGRPGRARHRGEVGPLDLALGCNRSTFEYDGFDRLAKLRFPVAQVGQDASSTTDYEQYDYGANGNRWWFRKRDGRVLNFSTIDRAGLKCEPRPVLSANQQSGVIESLDAFEDIRRCVLSSACL